MCCIAACRTTRLSRLMLDAMTASNRDGVGIAYIDGKRVRWFKTMNHQQLYDMIEKLPLPYIVHARLATIGAKGPALAHPFPIESRPRLTEEGKAEQVLAHNGHISEWRMLLHLVEPKAKPEESEWSDSRAIAHIVALRGTKILDHLSGNRFAVLNSNGISTWGNWHKVGDIEYSSYVYQSTVPYQYRKDYWSDWDDLSSRMYTAPEDDRIKVERYLAAERARTTGSLDAFDKRKANREAKRLARALDYTDKLSEK